MEVINLNLIPTGALPVVHASQYDEGRTFRANLMDGSTVYTLDGTETLECDVKKPDGNIVTVAVTNTSDSYVEIDTTLQMCACAGESLAELHITKGVQEIGTLNFILAVERSPLEGGIASQSEIDNLATQVAGLVASEVEAQYDSANVIFDDEPTEGHGNGYAVTSEGIGNAIDNALDMTDTASGAIATFESEYALPLRNLKIEINTVQSGSGTPSPDNVRPISGFTGANIHVADDETPHIIDNVTAISWQDEAGTVYGGSLDVTSGVLTVTHKIEDMGDLNYTHYSVAQGDLFRASLSDVKQITNQYVIPSALSDIYSATDTTARTNYTLSQAINNPSIDFVNNDYSDAPSFKTAMSGHKLVYELATPQTYQLTPTQISAIVGTNNVFTDTNGDTTLEYYTNKTVKDAINEVNDKADTNKTAIGTLSQLTTTDKSSLVGAVNEVVANKSNLIIKQVFTTSYTVEANSYINIDSSFIVIPSGYSFLGVVGWSTNDVNVFIASMRPFESGIYSIQLKNVSSTSRTQNLNIFCLFIKN